jgi:biopolymer transport protein ExbD
MNRYLRLIALAAVSAGALISIDACGRLTRLLPHKKSISQVQLARVDNAYPMPDAAKEDAIVVTVTRDGELWLGQSKTDISELGEQLRDRIADKLDRTMFLRADARARFLDVEDVLDSMRAAGADDVGLLTQKKDEAAKKEYFACSKPPEVPRGLDIMFFAIPRTPHDMPEKQLTYPTRIPRDILMVTEHSTGAAMPSREALTVVVQIRYWRGGTPFYKINETDVTKAELLPRLTDIYANRAERVLFILGDDRIDFAKVIEVVDIARSANVDHIGVLTPRIQAGQ